MKTKILLFLFISALLFSCNRCFKNFPPTIEITNEVPDSGWAGDTLKYNLLIKSNALPVSITIYPSLFINPNNYAVDTIIDMKEFYFTYTYVLPYPITYTVAVIKFKVSQNDQQKDSITRNLFIYVAPR